MVRLNICVEVWRGAILAALASSMTACGASSGSSTAMSNDNLDTNNSGTTGSSNGSGSGETTSSSGTTTTSTGTSNTGASNNGGSGVSSGSTTGTTNPIPNPFPCTPTGEYGHEGSGYEQCEGGFIHRVRVETCQSSLPRNSVIESPDPNFAECQQDTDCTEKPHGYCGYGEGNVPGPFCQYGCVEDSDCAEGQVCLCGSPVGSCVNANCTTDADCEPDLLCISQPGLLCGVDNRFACQTPEDECAGEGCDGFAACGLTPDGFRQCQAMCAIGRPLLVDSEERTAPAARRSDWCSPAVASTSLEAPSAVIAAEHWTDVGLMEHASIAAFARFALQLLQLGAPAELVEKTHAAMADETEHAKLAFTLASRFAGHDVGPGSLNLSGALEDTSVEAIVKAAVLEGCIGETVASLEAAEAQTRARDENVRAVLQAITTDERRHAELAWQFVRWALSEFGPRLRPVVAAAFGEGITRTLIESPRAARDASCEGYGVLSSETRQAIRQRAVDSVIRPCAAELLRSQPTQSESRFAAIRT